jgi:lipopolysaccharide export system permease protein
MKKIDKLVLRSFLGPFALTLCIVVFIFLMRLISQYLNELVGKDIDLLNYVKLIIFFSLITVPVALPLAVLLSSLMTFGNLGEFFELTAIKSAGISTWRAMRSVMVMVALVTLFSFWYNNEVAPWANLKGYSLLYDIKTAKATLNIKEGIFYNDLPGYNIKVDKKFPEPNDKSLKGLVIYRHPTNDYNAGNREVILADSGLMYTINDKSYLVFELYKGNQYSEAAQTSTSFSSADTRQFTRSYFDHYKMVVSLESFGLKRTDENQFQYHEYMKDAVELRKVADSLKKEYKKTKDGLFSQSKQYFSYSFQSESLPKTTAPKYGKWVDSLLKKKPVVLPAEKEQVLASALNQAQNIKSYAQSNKTYVYEKGKAWYRYDLEMHHKYTQAVSCFVMFLLGAPLGAIIKKGGFGIPVLVSVLFFILSYVLTLQGDKWAKDGLVWVPIGAWFSNTLLVFVGMYFADRALKDSRLFDKDIYIIWWERMKTKWQQRKANNLSN